MALNQNSPHLKRILSSGFAVSAVLMVAVSWPVYWALKKHRVITRPT